MTSVRSPVDTRRKILEAAFQEFYRNGFQGGSLNHIVEAAQTTKGALFHHFSGKSELGYAVVQEVIYPRLKKCWFDPLGDSINPIADIKRLLREFVKDEIASGRLAQGCPLNNLAQEMSPLDERFRKEIEKVYVTWRESLAAALARGVRAGKVRKDITPRNVAAFLIAAQTGIVGMAKNAQSQEFMTEAGEGLFWYLDNLKP
jgi:TetR/AcrR family transcriptional regulator, transcriptional repressor for nem operon